MPKRIIANYHGPLFADVHAGSSWKYVAWNALWDDLKSGNKRAAQLLAAAPGIYFLLREHEKGKIGYNNIYERFNERVLSQIPVSEVERYLREYAALPETQEKLDRDMLGAITKAYHAGACCDILSTGCGFTIRKTIDAYTEGMPLFGEIVANSLVRNGKGSEFEMAVYTPLERCHGLLGLLNHGDNRGLVYVGHGDEELPCMKKVAAEGGRIVIAPSAGREFKALASGLFGEKASTPRTREEIFRALAD